MNKDELRAHVLYHIIRQYGTKVEGEPAWVLPVIDDGPIVPHKIIPDPMGNVLVLHLQEVTDVQDN